MELPCYRRSSKAILPRVRRSAAHTSAGTGARHLPLLGFADGCFRRPLRTAATRPLNWRHWRTD